MRIAAVLVLYEITLEQSETYRSLLAQTKIPYLVYDNSQFPQPIQAEGCIQYIHNASNVGVSTAYNTAILWAQKHAFSHLLLLDADTQFPPNAFYKYAEAAVKYPHKIILPHIISNQRVVSPFYFKIGKAFYGDAIAFGNIKLGNILAINAGTLLPVAHFNFQLWYNPAILLDWSDVYAFRQMALLGAQAQHIPLILEHHLSEHSLQNTHAAMFRFSTYLDGLKQMQFKGFENLFTTFWACLKGLKLSYRHKKVWFIKKCYKALYAK